jgi:hypothetical protein
VVIRVRFPGVLWTGAEVIESTAYRALVFRSDGWLSIP